MVMLQQGPARVRGSFSVPHGIFEHKQDSVVRLNNGRLLYMYSTGSEIRQAIMPTGSVDDFIVDGSVVNTAISDEVVNGHFQYSHPSFASYYQTLTNGIGATVFRNEYGLFYFCARQSDRWHYAITNPAIDGGGREFSVELYKSASGNADDWQLHATLDSVSIQHYTDISTGLGQAFGSCGIPYVTPTGAMVVSSAVPSTFSVNGIGWRCGVYRSVDGGDSWTRQANLGVGIVGGAYLRTVSRNIFARTYGSGIHRMVMTLAGQYTSAEGYVVYSDDDGLNWVLGMNNVMEHLYHMYDEIQDRYYLIESHWTDSDIRENLAPGMAHPVLDEGVPLPGGGGRAIGLIQQLVTSELSGQIVYDGLIMWQGRIMRASSIEEIEEETAIDDLGPTRRKFAFRAPLSTQF